MIFSLKYCAKDYNGVVNKSIIKWYFYKSSSFKAESIAITIFFSSTFG